MFIGVISDTHGQLSEAALEALKGVHHIVHAGDIGGPELIPALERIAPVTAVRGNMDHGGWAQKLPPADMVALDGVYVYILHDIHTLDLDPLAAGVKVVISGHTHQAAMKTVDGVLYFNPGSASSGRYASPESVGIIELASNRIVPQILRL